MKIINIFLITLLALGITYSQSVAQKIQGVATYQSSSSVKLQLDSTKINPEAMAQMQRQLQQQMQKEYTLTFDNASSAWKQVESLGGGPASAEAGGARIVFMGDSEIAIIYKNPQEGKLEEGAEMMGKPFIIKDELPLYEWKMIGETKQIGQYTCQKAVCQFEVDSKKFSSDMDEMETIKNTVTVEAWFTPEIPVSHGPSTFWGLPGLIMELKSGGQTYICSKIVLNPKEGITIDKPKKGKVINRQEYQALQAEKMQDMMKKYSGGQGGDKIQMRIGG